MKFSFEGPQQPRPREESNIDPIFILKNVTEGLAAKSAAVTEQREHPPEDIDQSMIGEPAPDLRETIERLQNRG